MRFSTAFAARMEVADAFKQGTRYEFEDVWAQGFADGLLKMWRTNGVQFDSLSDRSPMTISASASRVQDYDIAAIVHTMDPEAYQDGRGDMVWRDVVGRATVEDIDIDVDGDTLSIERIELADWRLRQPPLSFTETLDIIDLEFFLSSTTLILPEVSSFYGAISIGAFRATGLVSANTDPLEVLSIDDITIREFSIDGLDELTFTGIDFTDSSTALSAEKMSLGGMVFGGIDGLAQLLADFARGKEPNVQAFFQALGFIQLAGVDILSTTSDRVFLGNFKAASSTFIGLIPTETSWEVADLVLPASMLDDELRMILNQFGYDTIGFGLTINTRWSEGDNLEIEMTLDLTELANAVLEVELSGIPLSLFDMSEEELAIEDFSAAALTRARFAFNDEAVVDHGIKFFADQMNVPKDQFRKQTLTELPTHLSSSWTDPEIGEAMRQSGLLEDLTAAVRQLIEVPGSSITVEAGPVATVPILTLAEATDVSPARWLNYLGLSISNKPGTPRPAD